MADDDDQKGTPGHTYRGNTDHDPKPENAKRLNSLPRGMGGGPSLTPGGGSSFGSSTPRQPQPSPNTVEQKSDRAPERLAKGELSEKFNAASRPPPRDGAGAQQPTPPGPPTRPAPAAAAVPIVPNKDFQTRAVGERPQFKRQGDEPEQDSQKAPVNRNFQDRTPGERPAFKREGDAQEQRSGQDRQKDQPGANRNFQDRAPGERPAFKQQELADDRNDRGR